MQAEPTTKIKVKFPGDREIDVLRPAKANPDHLLQQIFDEFNDGSTHACEEFKAQKECRSFSAFDFVRLNEQWYQCQSVGWEAVTQEFVEEIDRKVREHPLFLVHGSWVALDRVMFAQNHAVDPFDL
jgi:hypothetical protein